MYQAISRPIPRIAHICAINGLLIASHSVFILHYSVLIYGTIILIGTYSLLNLKSRLDDVAIAATMVTLYCVVAVAQVFFYKKVNVYFGGLIFLVAVFYFKYQRHPIVLKAGLDTFFWAVCIFFVLEIFIKIGASFPGSEIITEKFIQLASSRVDVFRITALYGTPLILGSIVVFYLLREMFLYRRPLHIALLLLMLLSTGSRSALLIGIFVFLSSFIARKPKFSCRIFGKILLLGAVLFSVIYSLPGSERFERTIDRSFTVFSQDILADQSIRGRSSTSGAAFLEVISSPFSIAFGLEDTERSDSAISSISQQNGLVFTVFLLLSLCFYIFQSMQCFSAWVTFLAVIGLALSAGGALSFSPLIVLTAFIFEIKGRSLIKIERSSALAIKNRAHHKLHILSPGNAA